MAEPIEDVTFDPSRRFQIWDYSVSHSQMLLRSNKENVHASRIEVLFKNIESFHLATVVSAMKVRVVSLTEAETRVGKILAPPHHDQKVYLVRSAEGDGYVVAGAAFMSEDTLEYYDPTGFSGSYLPGRAP